MNRKIKKKKGIRIKNLRVKLSTLLIIGFAVLGIILAYVLKIILTSPNITTSIVAPKGYTTFIYDQNGKEVDRLHTGSSNRVYVELDEIPQALQDAVIVMEDKRFYKHNGIDLQGIMRAVVIDICSMSFKEGASTLTQQLIKNNVLTSDKKIDRKIREMYLATSLEKKLYKKFKDKKQAKDYVLELYLNSIGLGKGCNGVQSAANRYFGKDVKDLTLDECTVIAAIIQTPSRLEPVNHPEENNERRKIILEYMLSNDMISEDEYNNSVNADPYKYISDVNKAYQETTMTNSYFVDTLIEEITKDLMKEKGLNENLANTLIYSGGLKIYSTMDKNVQNSIDSVFSDASSSFATNSSEYTLVYNLDLEKPDGSPKYYQKTKILSNNSDALVNETIASMKATLMEEDDKILNESHYLICQPQAAMVVMDHTNGHVKGLTGGRGNKSVNRGLNRATQTTRQAGSCFKPLAAFAPAIDMKKMTAATVQDDIPYYLAKYGNKQINNWWGGSYRGLSTLREGTRDSMNVIAVKTVMNIGLDNAFNYLTKFGFTTLVSSRKENGKVYSDKTPSIALGGLTDGVSLLELTSAYASIANYGVLCKPIFYTKVTDINGNVILSKETTKSKVLEESTAYIVTTMMRDVVTSGTGGSASVPNQYVAGKTGTTSDSKDLLFVGYTPYYTAGIWVGHDSPKVIKGDQSVHTKAWRKVMEKVHKGLPYKTFSRPNTVTTAAVCKESGLLAVSGLCDCDQRGNMIYTEYFSTDNVPTETCNVHVRADVVRYEDKYYLANNNTPGNFEVLSVVFIKRPASLSSYYDISNKSIIQDSIYEVPKEYFDPFGFGLTEEIDSEIDDTIKEKDKNKDKDKDKNKDKDKTQQKEFDEIDESLENTWSEDNIKEVDESISEEFITN